MDIRLSSEAEYELADPLPDAMIEAMRAFGYTPQAAIADLIDNSITAGARNVWLTLFWDGASSYIAVRDDGRGMNADKLLTAMRPGGLDPLQPRPPKDLGRFGLGLKTASFSQCRRLTVASRGSEGVVSIRRWDLDYVRQVHEWRLLKGVADGSAGRIAELTDAPTGTIVLWEQMDRLVGGAAVDDQRAHRRFLDLASEIEQHLGMVFHRFLQRKGCLRIAINGNQVAAWDPFLIGCQATQYLGEETLYLRGQEMVVRPYVLPHHSKIDQDVHRAAAGPSGWNAHQGFYVYRNERLLVAGDWLGLPFKKEEHYKLARIQVDIPNSLDADWQIDVRKSRARPPGVLREDFRRIATMTRERAAAVYRHRGKVLGGYTPTTRTAPWERVVRHGKVFYRVNRDHPLVVELLADGDRYRANLLALLRLLEETIPVPLIAIDHAERPEHQGGPFEAAPSAEVAAVVQAIFEALLVQGQDPATARQRLLTMEPFHQYPELLVGLDQGSEESDR